MRKGVKGFRYFSLFCMKIIVVAERGFNGFVTCLLFRIDH